MSTPTISVGSVSDLQSIDYTDALICIVEDINRTSGNPFMWKSSGTINEGTIYPDKNNPYPSSPSGPGQTGVWEMMFDGPISVLWFGADDTASRDTTVDIQAAIDAALTLYKNVYIPTGNYLIDTTPSLVINANNGTPQVPVGWGMTIEGDKPDSGRGTALKRTIGDAILKIDLEYPGSGRWFGITIKNLVLDGEGTYLATGLEIKHTSLSLVDNVHFRFFYKAIDIGDNSHNNTFTRCFFEGGYTMGSGIDNNGFTTFASPVPEPAGSNGNIVQACRWNGIKTPFDLTDGEQWTIREGDIEGNNGQSIINLKSTLSGMRVERNVLMTDAIFKVIGDDNHIECFFHADLTTAQDYLFLINGYRNKIIIGRHFTGIVDPASTGTSNEIFMRESIPLVSSTLADSRSVVLKPFVGNGLANLVPNSEDLGDTSVWSVKYGSATILAPNKIQHFWNTSTHYLLYSTELGTFSSGVLYYGCKLIDCNSGGWFIVIHETGTNNILDFYPIGYPLGYYFWSSYIIPSSMNISIGIRNYGGADGGFLEATNFFVTKDKFSRYIKTIGLPLEVSEVDRYYGTY
jgi:hypothetical protein